MAKGVKGFALLELIIVLGLIVLLFGFGVLMSEKSYTKQIYQSEAHTIVTLLQAVRNKAMNNFYNSSHGLFIDQDKYVLFTGDAYDPGNAKNQEIPRNEGVNINSTPNTIIFNRLNGSIAQNTTIIIQDKNKIYQIEVDKSGLIKW